MRWFYDKFKPWKRRCAPLTFDIFYKRKYIRTEGVAMNNQDKKFKAICSVPEWKLVQESLPGKISSFSLARIKTKAAAADRLAKKWMDLSRKQKRVANDREAAVRSTEKAGLFAEVRTSFKNRQRVLEREATRKKALTLVNILKKSKSDIKRTSKISRTENLPTTPVKPKKTGIPAGIKGHISSRNRRDQARRDSR